MVRQDSLFDPVEERHQEQEVRAHQQQERQAKIDILTQELNDLKKQQRQEETKILEQLLEGNDDLKDEYTKVAKENQISAFKSTMSFDENFTTNILFRSFLLAHVKKINPDQFSEIEDEFSPAIEELERKINAV